MQSLRQRFEAKRPPRLFYVLPRFLSTRTGHQAREAVIEEFGGSAPANVDAIARALWDGFYKTDRESRSGVVLQREMRAALQVSPAAPVAGAENRVTGTALTAFTPTPTSTPGSQNPILKPPRTLDEVRDRIRQALKALRDLAKGENGEGRYILNEEIDAHLKAACGEGFLQSDIAAGLRPFIRILLDQPDDAEFNIVGVWRQLDELVRPALPSPEPKFTPARTPFTPRYASEQELENAIAGSWRAKVRSLLRGRGSNKPHEQPTGNAPDAHHAPAAPAPQPPAAHSPAPQAPAAQPAKPAA
jgi:hypothetical protein